MQASSKALSSKICLMLSLWTMIYVTVIIMEIDTVQDLLYTVITLIVYVLSYNKSIFNFC